MSERYKKYRQREKRLQRKKYRKWQRKRKGKVKE